MGEMLLAAIGAFFVAIMAEMIFNVVAILLALGLAVAGVMAAIDDRIIRLVDQ